MNLFFFRKNCNGVCNQIFITRKIEDIQWFDGEYGSYFISETGFFIFARVQSSTQNMLKSCLTGEINSVFNVKTLNFLFITFSLGFLTCFVQSWTLHAIHDGFLI